MSGLCSLVTILHFSHQCYQAVAAIAFHKFVIIFCVCLELQQNGTKRFIFFSYLTVFSLISSMGIGIGIIITHLQAGSVPGEVTASLQGVAAGTILYVVMFEVLNRERAKHVPGLLQLLGIMMGFGVLLLIEIFGKFSYNWSRQTGLITTGQHEHEE